ALHVGQEQLARHRPVYYQRRQEAVGPHDSQERARLPAAVRRLAHQPLATRSVAVAPRPVRLGRRLIQEDKAVEVQLRHHLTLPGGAAGGHVRACLLLGVDHFFLNVKPSRRKARQTVSTEQGKPRRSRSSAALRWGCAWTKWRRRSSWGASLGRGPGRLFRGWICPVSRRRCKSRRTQAVLTVYFCATAPVCMPASPSASSRVRRS